MTNLSLQKFKEVLLENNLEIRRKFVEKSPNCKFIEILSLDTAEMFMVKISNKYKLALTEYDTDVYDIKQINIDINNINQEELLNQLYKNINIENDKDAILSSGENVEEKLLDSYKKQINISEVQDNDIIILKDIIDQINRLKFCVRNINPSIAIEYKNFLCVLKNNEKIIYYNIIQNALKIETRILHVIVDLEFMYENIKNLLNTIIQVKSGIIQILSKNHETHCDTLIQILSLKDYIVQYCNKILENKTKHTEYLVQFSEILQKVSTMKNEIREKIKKIDESDNPNSSASIYNKAIFMKEFKDISDTQDEVNLNMRKLKMENENIILTMDKIFFENIVKLSDIVENFKKLTKLCEPNK